jgi:hypothetical protein
MKRRALIVSFTAEGENRQIAALLTNSRWKTDCINGDAIISDESDWTERVFT